MVELINNILKRGSPQDFREQDEFHIGVFGRSAHQFLTVGNRLRFESDPRFYATESGAGIDGRYEQKRAHPALMVIVTRLK